MISVEYEHASLCCLSLRTTNKWNIDNQKITHQPNCFHSYRSKYFNQIIGYTKKYSNFATVIELSVLGVSPSGLTMFLRAALSCCTNIQKK